MEDSRGLRLFTAIELPEEWRSTLARASDQLESVARNGVKWVRPELMHVTLVFLGDQPRSRIDQISAAMDQAAARSAPFLLSLGRPGFFGSPYRLRALWIGLRDVPPELLRLHSSLVSGLEERQIAFEAKPLVPHVTIGRPRAGMDSAASLHLHDALLHLGEKRQLSTRIEEMVLLASRLSPQGPEYTPMHRARLGGTGGK
jgi:RNA 2',3'-cyclic 3'-phosphodiesterase